MTYKSNTIRIIGGTHRSRKIIFPDKEELRPTGDRTKETLFNWVQCKIDTAVCLDLFAGSGALGIEALSRGAQEVVFVEKNPFIAAALSNNIEMLKLTRCKVCQIDALRWVASNKINRKFNLVFLDPPFQSGLLSKSCSVLEKSVLLAKDCLIYIEQARPIAMGGVPSAWSLKKESKIGKVFSYLYSTNMN